MGRPQSVTPALTHSGGHGTDTLFSRLSSLDPLPISLPQMQRIILQALVA